MKLFVDENLSPRLSRGLAALFEKQHTVVHLVDKFGRRGLSDQEWIEALGREGGWCVLSGDRRIAQKKPSRDAFLRANLVGFFPQPSVMDLKLHRMAARILILWPVLEAIDKNTTRGCYELGIKTNQLRQIS